MSLPEGVTSPVTVVSDRATWSLEEQARDLDHGWTYSDVVGQDRLTQEPQILVSNLS